MRINSLSYWAMRTRWKRSYAGNWVRGSPDGSILTVFRCRWDRERWNWSIKSGGQCTFSQKSYPTCKRAKQEVLRAAAQGG